MITNPDQSTAAARAERIRGAGLKVTAPRLAILAAVERNRSHPSAEEIHRGLTVDHPSLSLSTVYATLSSFIRAGLVQNLPEVDGRLRVDGVLEPHDHAVCRRCGTIYDIDRTELETRAPAELPGGMKVVGVRVEYDVVCASCLRSN